MVRKSIDYMKKIKLLFLLLFCFAIQGLNAQIDTFATLIGAPVNTTGWNLVGQAKVAKIKYTDSSEVLVCNTTTFTSGGIFYNQPINLAKCSRWVADFDFRIFDGNSADGLTFCFLDKPPTGFVIGQGLGIPQNANGLKVCFDTWNNCQCNGAYEMPKLEIRWGVGYTVQNSSGSGATCWDSTVVGNGECNAVGYPTLYNYNGSLSFIRSDNYNHATIKYDRGLISVYLNGKLYTSDTIPVAQQPLFTGYLGFTAGTGSNYDNHSIRNVIIRSDIPPSNAGPAQTICHGKTAPLGVVSDTSFVYKWTPSTGLSSASISDPTVTLTNNTLSPITQKYYVSTAYDSATTCSTIDSVIVTVNPYPHLNPILGNTNVCINKTSQLTNDSAGGTWLSVNPLIGTISNNGLVSGFIVDTTTVKYFVTNIYNCIDSVSALVSVRPIPVIDTISGIKVVCATHTTLVSNDTLNGIWTSINTSIATINSNSGLISGLTAGLDTIRYTVTTGFGCVDSVSALVKVNPLPVIGAINSITNQVCAGKIIKLTDTTSGGVWLSIDTSIATIDTAGYVTGKKAGSITIRYIVTNSNGCSDSVATSITVNALPIVNAIGGNNALCIGKTTQLNNSTNNGIWVSTNNSIASVDNTGKVNGNNAGTDTVRYIVTNSNGCVDSVSSKIIVNPLPVIGLISGNNTLCFGKTSQLSDTTVGGSWESTNTTIATVDNTGKITGLSSGTDTIRLIVTNGKGCTDSVSIPVTVNALPNISNITGINTICLGKTTQLTDGTNGGTWVSTNTSVASVDNTGLVTGNISGNATIRYIVTNSNNCTDSVSTPVTVNALPLIAPIGGTPSACFGKNNTLTETTTGGSWVSTNTAVATINSTGNVQTVSAGTTTIRYIVNNGAGCIDSVSALYTVNALPSINAIGGNNNVCIGNNTQLSETTSGGSWTNTNTTVASVDNTGKLTGITAGTDTIRYIVTNGAGCTDSVFTTVNIKSPSSSNTPVSICSSALPFTWNNNTYNNGGTYLVHLTNAVNCDSAATLVLSIKQTSTSTTNTSICAAALPYTWNGNQYNTGGTYTVHLTNAVNCDSAANLVLFIKQPSVSTTNTSICASALPYTWNGNQYNTGGTYTVHLNNAVNCDSAATLVLAVKQPSVSTTNASVCAAALPYTWNGNQYNAGGTYTVHLNNAVNCDSAATLILSVKQPSVSTTTASVCSSALPYSWNGNNYNSAGTYIVHLNNAVNCDSAATLILSVKATSTSATNATVCSNLLPYTWNGNNYNTTGAYIVHLQNAAGCDSAATLNLTVEDFTFNLQVSPGSTIASPLATGTSLNAQITSTSTISSSVWEPSNMFVNNLSSQKVVIADTANTFTVIVTATSQDGCLATDSSTVYISPSTVVYIPNALAPSGPANSDASSIKIYGKTIKSAILRIYNQWGQLIKELDDPINTGWDGTFDGKPQPTGVYVYVAKITYLNGKTETRSGSINLIR